MTEIPMFDTVTPSALVGHISTAPHGDAVAGYVGDTSFIDAAVLFHLFPNAYHLTISGTTHPGRCSDIEPRFGVLVRLIQWLENEADISQGPPWVYTFAANMAAVIGVLHAAGVPIASFDTPAPLPDPGESRAHYIRRVGVILWSAHFNFHPHICAPHVCGFPQVHNTQWTDNAPAVPGDADQSLIGNAEVSFPSGRGSDLDPHRFRMFATGSQHQPGGTRGGPFGSPFGPLDERLTVIHFYFHHAHGSKLLLDHLRAEMLWLAHRLDRVAIVNNPNPDGTPSWQADFRGVRHARLSRMATTGDLA